jgi:hypothetical protein
MIETDMKNSFSLAACLLLALTCVVEAQGNRGGGNRSGGKGISGVADNPQEVGESGIAWYTTWKTGLAEAKRSNRPIFFMSAATTCSGIPGVF